MSWQSSARSLLRDLKRSKTSKTSTPTDLQLEQLHVKVANENEESRKENVWNNIHPIAEIIGGEKGRTSTFFMNLALRDAKTARFCSEYVSSILVDWMTLLSQQTAQTILVNRNQTLHLKNDTYSPGVSAELIMSYSSPHYSTKGPQKPPRLIPFSSVLIRDRCRPDSSLTSAELYLILAMAAKHHIPVDGKIGIDLRLVVIYSHWVQILYVTTTVSYITSIVDGHVDIADTIKVQPSAWFNFLDPSGQLQILLSTFEGIEVDYKSGSQGDRRIQVPLQERSNNSPKQRWKRHRDGREELDNPKSKSRRVLHK